MAASSSKTGQGGRSVPKEPRLKTPLSADFSKVEKECVTAMLQLQGVRDRAILASRLSMMFGTPRTKGAKAAPGKVVEKSKITPPPPNMSREGFKDTCAGQILKLIVKFTKSVPEQSKVSTYLLNRLILCLQSQYDKVNSQVPVALYSVKILTGEAASMNTLLRISDILLQRTQSQFVVELPQEEGQVAEVGGTPTYAQIKAHDFMSDIEYTAESVNQIARQIGLTEVDIPADLSSGKAAAQASARDPARHPVAVGTKKRKLGAPKGGTGKKNKGESGEGGGGGQQHYGPAGQDDRGATGKSPDDESAIDGIESSDSEDMYV
jgi:hypothetical protein